MSSYVNKTKIAILLATYNGLPYIREQIESLMNQTYQDWHLYIHDDESCDGTVEVLQEYKKKYPNKISIVDGGRTGSAKNNFLYLLNQVESSIYMFCDQDDVWLSNKIETEINAFEETEVGDCPVLVFTDLKIVNESLQTIAESLWKYYNLCTENIKMESLIIQNVITGCTMLINKKMRDMMISYHEIDNVPMHDKWAAMIALQFGKIVRVNEQMILYRQHEYNSVGAKKSFGFYYIVSKLRKLSELKIQYSFTRRQAQEFCRVFDMREDSLLYRYGEIDKKSKIQRLLFYLKNKIYSNRISQLVGLILAG